MRFVNRHLGPQKILQVRGTEGPCRLDGEGRPRGILRPDIGVFPRGTPPPFANLRRVQMGREVLCEQLSPLRALDCPVGLLESYAGACDALEEGRH